MSRSDELKERLETRRILPVQVQLAASLGYKPAMRLRLPALKLGRSETQWDEDIHQGLPPDLKRVLRSATRSGEYALPIRLSLTWGADCAERALGVFEAVIRNDSRPRRALEAARAWLKQGADVAECRSAAMGANEAIPRGERAAKTTFARPRTVGGVSVRTGAEAAAYAARQAVDAILQSRECEDEMPDWVPYDQAAIHAGHAANWAAHAQPDPAEEFAWQRRRLIELILARDADRWYSEESEAGSEDATDDAPAAEAKAREVKTRAREIAYTLGIIFAGVGIVGLGIRRFVMEVLGIPEDDQMATTVSAIIGYVLGGMFLLGFVILLPLGVFLQKRAKGSTPWFPALPNWLIPIIIVVVLGIGFLLVYLTST